MTMGRSAPSIRFISAALIAAVCMPPASAWAGSSSAKTLYQQHCARCHGDQGTGDGPAHTMQRPWPRDFTNGSYKFKSTPGDSLPLLSDVERVVAHGIPRTSMSGYAKWLSAEEIRMVSEYVLNFSKKSGAPENPGLPVQAPAELTRKSPVLKPGRIANGKAVFAARCASCHGADGRGLGELAGQLKDKDGFLINPVDLTDARGYGGGSSAADIYKTLTVGISGSPMVSFAETLNDTTRADVAAYAASLQVAPEQRTLPSAEAWKRALPSRERGEYLVRAMSCALCHNSYDKDGAYYVKPYLAGGVAITLPGTGVFPTRNITSHPADGLGEWTEEEIMRVITTGHAPDRRIEAFSMPWVYFSHLTEEDAKDIAVYVKSLKAIENRVPPRRYYPIWERLWTRMRQLVGLEHGRLEYPPYNVGSRRSQAEKLDGQRERDLRSQGAENREGGR
ncbi:MAG: c-type cytochrome [Candidatus Omnitrophica bacterium]|nr:c-type cytochrome [Candidatus Omnitrophota bacterium]